MASKQSQSTKGKVIAAMPALLSVADLNKAIDNCIKSMTGIQAKVQTIGVQALMHLEKHGDIGPVNRLMVGMPTGMRRQALASWLLSYGALSINTGEDKKTKVFNFDKAKKTNAEGANGDPWYNHLPAQNDVSNVFDLQKAIHGLLTRAKGKTIMLHGKTLSVEHAVDALKTLAALAGEDYKPDVDQHGDKGTKNSGAAPDPIQKDQKRVEGGTKATATQSA